jgi:hypothetical protein
MDVDTLVSAIFGWVLGMVVVQSLLEIRHRRKMQRLRDKAKTKTGG